MNKIGVFDTIYGEIKCPHCNKFHKFEEQTKNYECIMWRYTLGDYIDNKTSTYVYPFEAFCETAYNNKRIKKFNGNVIIVKGQIVKFVNDIELQKLNIKKLKNIEEGLGRKLEYEKLCNKGVGYAQEKININEHPKKIGDRIVALKNNWLITQIYKEILVTQKYDRCYNIHSSFYKDSFVYKVTNHLGDRFIRVTNDDMEVCYIDGDYKNYDSDYPHNFILQHGCELIEI